MSKLAYRFINNPQVRDLLRAIKESEEKLKEVRGLVGVEVLKLQDATISKDIALKEIEELKGKKFQLLERIKKEITTELADLIRKKDSSVDELRGIIVNNKGLYSKNKKLKEEISKTEKQLEEGEKRERDILDAIKRKQSKEQERLNTISENLNKLTLHIEGLKPIARELKGFIEKSIKAKEEYLAIQTKMDIAVRMKDNSLREAMNNLSKIAREKQELSSEKQYFQDFYGKIATYVRVAKETIAEINKELEGKAPVEFELPPNIEKTKVNINNFTEIFDI